MEVSDLVSVYLEPKNYRQLFKYALQLSRNMETANDLMGDLALSIFTKEKMKEAKEPMAYFRTCLRNNYCTMQKKSKQMIVTDPYLLSNNNNANETYEEPKTSEKEVRAKLREALSEYSDDLIEAFEMFYLEGYSQKALAKELGMAPNTLAQQFKRMKAHIRSKHPMLFMQVIMLYLFGNY